MPFSTLNRAQTKVSSWRLRDRRPHVELVIHWSLANVQRVMALVNIGAKYSLVYGKPEQFPSPSAYIGGYGRQTM